MARLSTYQVETQLFQVLALCCSEAYMHTGVSFDDLPNKNR